MDAAPVRVEILTRRFGRRLALDAISLEVQPREIVALAGANGSGKTTLLRILAGFIGSHGGSARVFGLDPLADARSVSRRARFSFAPPALFDELTAREHLLQLGRLSGAVSMLDVDRALDLVGLAERADDRAGTFSFGMRQRLGLGLALIPLPELLILDEPTDGLDPLGVIELRRLLGELRDEHQMTILVAQHHFGEVEELVDRVVVLDEGHLLLEGRPSELVRAGARLRLTCADPKRLAAALTARGIEVEQRGAALALEPEALTLDDALELARATETPLTSFALVEPSLETILVERLRRARDGRLESPHTNHFEATP